MGRRWGCMLAAALVLGAAAAVASSETDAIAHALLAHACPGLEAAQVRAHLWPRLEIVAHGIRLAASNGAWTLTAKDLDLQVSLARLLGVERPLGPLHLVQPVLRIARSEDRPIGTRSVPALSEWRIDDGTIELVDSGRDVEVRIDGLQAAAVPAGPGRQTVTARGRVDDTPFALTASGPDVPTFWSGDAAAIEVEVSVPSRRAHVSATIESVNDGVRLRRLDARIGGTQVQGSIAIDGASHHPQITADLGLDRLDVTSRHLRADARLARAADGTVRLSVARLQVGGLTLERLQSTVTAEDGGIRLHAAAAALGTADGFVDLRARPPRGRLQFALHDVPTTELPPPLAAVLTRILGTAVVDRAGGALRLDGGVVHVERLDVATPDGPAHGRGTLDTEAGQLDLTVVRGEPPDAAVVHLTGTPRDPRVSDGQAP